MFHFLLSCFSLTELTSNFFVPEIMAFTVPFVPLKEVSFPKDPFPLLPKFGDDEVINQTVVSCINKARFKEETVAIKEFNRNKWDETGKTFLKEAKILKSLNHPNVVNFKNACYQSLAIMFENTDLSTWENC